MKTATRTAYVIQRSDGKYLEERPMSGMDRWTEHLRRATVYTEKANADDTAFLSYESKYKIVKVTITITRATGVTKCTSSKKSKTPRRRSRR